MHHTLSCLIIRQDMARKKLSKLSAFLTIFAVASAARAESYVAFSQIDSEYSEPSGTIEAKNLPNTFSQDSLNICSAMTAGFLLDASNCRTQKRSCKPDGKISIEEIEREAFSRVDLARYAHVVPTEEKFKSFYDGISEYGSPALILSNVIHRNRDATNHKCASLDKILTSFGDDKSLRSAQERSWEKLKDTYNTYRKKIADCPTCKDDAFSTAKSDIAQNFKITTDDVDLLKAFAQGTYDKFLDRLLIPAECRKVGQTSYFFDRDKLELKKFPENELKTSYYEETRDELKKVLSKGLPVGINNVCLGDDFDMQKTKDKSALIHRQGSNVIAGGQSEGASNMFACSKPHSVVVSGYRKVCKKGTNPNDPKNCRESLKIENSWGKSWQKENNDGWVDARSFLDRTAYLGNNLLWIDDKQQN